MFLHACFWTFAPPHFVANYRIDTLEMMVIGQHWILATFKHPAFQGWVVEILGLIFLRAEFVPYLAAQIAAVLSVWGIWKLAQKFLSPQLALVAALAMLSYLYFNLDSTLYNNRTFMRSFWILAVYFLYCAIENNTATENNAAAGNKYRYWVLTGIMLGLGLACKLTSFLLVFTILAYMFLDPYARKFWKTPGPYLSTGICFLMFLPFLIWFMKHQFAVLSYAQNSVAPTSPSLLDHFIDPLRFALSQLFAIGPTLIPLLPFLGWRWKLNESGMWKTPERRFLTFFIFFPFLVQLLLAASLGGGGMRTALGCHLWVFLPIFLLTVMQFNGENVKSFRRSIRLVFFNIALFALLGILYFSLGPYFSGKGSREHFPGRDLAAAVETIWEERFGTPLPYVRGDDQPAQNVAVYAKSRPTLFFELWATEEDFEEKGGVLLWMESVSAPQPEGSLQGSYADLDFDDRDFADFGYSPETGYPDEWLKLFPNAEILPSIILPKKTYFDVPAAKIGIAIVPPRP